MNAQGRSRPSSGPIPGVVASSLALAIPQPVRGREDGVPGTPRVKAPVVVAVDLVRDYRGGTPIPYGAHAHATRDPPSWQDPRETTLGACTKGVTR